MLSFRTFTAPRDLTECVGVSLTVDKHIILAKNRDRAYKPDLEIIHTLLGGTEVAYLHDIATDWSEGMNEHGIGIVNTALFVGYDEDEKKILKKGGKPSKDGARIRRALTKRTLDDVVKSVSSYAGGVKGHTIISSPDATYTVELTSRHKAHIIRRPPGTFLVRTNHGDEYPDAGYTQADEPEDYQSSVVRRANAIAMLKQAKHLDDVLPALRHQQYDPHSNLNVLRDTKKMSTSSQLLLDLSALTLELDYLADKVDKTPKIVRVFPDGYQPRITVRLRKIERDEVS